MSATVAPSELSATRVRTRWSMGVSAVVHALILALIIFMPRPEPGGPSLTEITLIDPGDLGSPAAPSAPAAAPQASAGLVAARANDTHFERTLRRADAAPDPQDVSSPDDRISARLAAMQSNVTTNSAGSVTGAPPSVWTASPAVAGALGTGGGNSLTLHRGGGGGGGGLTLGRGPGRGSGALSPATAPTPAVAQAEPARESGSSARRMLAGATLMGPIADRPVLTHVTPVYPEWAKREAVEGSVTLYFVVRPDGSVKENVLVQKTAGFGDFDDSARAALRAWRFEPLRDGRTGEQWGTITFHFRIRDGG